MHNVAAPGKSGATCFSHRKRLRFYVATLALRASGYSYPEIARLMGRRHHGSAKYWHRRAQRYDEAIKSL